MFIKAVKTYTRKNGQPQYSCRLVENYRVKDKVRQRTLLNLGSKWPVDKSLWPAVAQRVQEKLDGQLQLWDANLQVKRQAEDIVRRLRPRLATAKFTNRCHRRDRAGFAATRRTSFGRRRTHEPRRTPTTRMVRTAAQPRRDRTRCQALCRTADRTHAPSEQRTRSPTLYPVVTSSPRAQFIIHPSLTAKHGRSKYLGTQDHVDILNIAFPYFLIAGRRVTLSIRIAGDHCHGDDRTLQTIRYLSPIKLRKILQTGNLQLGKHLYNY